MSVVDTAKTRLKKIIEEKAFVRATDAQIISRKGTEHSRWLFDIRSILMKSDVMRDVATLFWSEYEKQNIQIGSIETSGIALAAGLIAQAHEHNVSACTGFFIRKSRKKDGLLKMIEGTLGNEDIVLVDDILNSGKSIMRQIEVLKSEGRHVSSVWTLIQFRESAFYKFLTDENIDVRTVFNLSDFTETLGTLPPSRHALPQPQQSFEVVWKFSSPRPSYFHVVPKSEPAFDASRIYIGSDSGVFRCLAQDDGHIIWEFQTGFHPGKKGIFSSPLVANNIVYFGAYDGNVYALDTKTGNKLWVSFDADWVGSSPAIATDLGIVFIGLEFGLWRRRGGIIALDAKTGARIWQYEMPCYTHSSPLYIESHKQVVIGSNDGAVYLFDAKTGALQWRYETAPLTADAINTGFSEHDIKASFVYNPSQDTIIFGTLSGDVISLSRGDGKKQKSFKADFGVYSTPLLLDDTIIISSLDHHVYCLDIDTFLEKWRWYAGARVFSSPVCIGDSVYVGTNAGMLVELDPAHGTVRSTFFVPERITNRLMYTAQSDTYFLTTYANEVYCLRKRAVHPASSAILAK